MELCPVEPYEGFAPGISVGGRDLSACVHIFPHRIEGEGHFLALMRRRGASVDREEPSGREHGPMRFRRLRKNFCPTSAGTGAGGRFFCRQDQIYYLPEGVGAGKRPSVSAHGTSGGNNETFEV